MLNESTEYMYMYILGARICYLRTIQDGRREIGK